MSAVTGQAYNLRPPQPVDQPGYILRQLWMQAAELVEDDLAEDIRGRLQSRPGACLVPQWTTRRTSRALAGELGRHDGGVLAVAVLADGRVVTGGVDRRVLMWDPAAPGAARPSWVATTPGGDGGGAARWAGGHRRVRRAGADMGSGRSRRRPG